MNTTLSKNEPKRNIPLHYPTLNLVRLLTRTSNNYLIMDNRCHLVYHVLYYISSAVAQSKVMLSRRSHTQQKKHSKPRELLIKASDHDTFPTKTLLCYTLVIKAFTFSNPHILLIKQKVLSFRSHHFSQSH